MSSSNDNFCVTKNYLNDYYVNNFKKSKLKIGFKNKKIF